ncbi:hypothetical protein [Phormidesmis priestleyi]
MVKHDRLLSQQNQPDSETNETSQSQAVTRRNVEDQERDKAVYEYLLNCLSDLGLERAKSKSKSTEKPKPNESYIALQWGQKDNRIFVRRVLRAVLPEYYQDGKSADQKLPGLTLGKLVEILESIQTYWSKQDPTSFTGQIPRILTRAEKLRAFCKFFQLSIDERDRLELPMRPADVLMQQLVDSMTDPIKGLSNDELVRFYQMALNLYQSLRSGDRSLTDTGEKNSIKELIETRIQKLVDEHFYKRPNPEQKEKVIKTLVHKVEREISRISFQCGFRQAESLLNEEQPQIKITDRCLPRSFVEHLIRSVFENEILTDEFPVYIKHYTVEKIKPLPLYVKTPDKPIGLLNLDLLDKNENEEDINGLERQFAYKVVVHFYVKLPKNYKPAFVNPNFPPEDEFLEERLDFFEEVRGVGSLISLITSAVNSVLLWGIPVLQKRQYLPIAQELLRINEIIGQNGYSPVWSNILVRLCKEKDVETAIREKKPYEKVAQDYELSYGEFCGFDLIEVTAKASLYARLRAIKQAGINADEYISQLCDRVRESEALKQAASYLHLHPFSLRAMEAHLNQTIFFEDKYRSCNKHFEFIEQEPGEQWSLVAYDAHLAIARAYLMEGLYRIGKRYIHVLKSHVERGYLNDTLLAKYQLCLYRYYFLADLKDPDFSEYGRYEAVREAWNALEQAERHLKNRLEKYDVLNEFSQSNFHPFCYLLSKINAHRAKLHIFASSYTPRDGTQWGTLSHPIRLLEKARIYAAQDGEPLDYSYWSSYQSWCYLILAYLGDNSRSKLSSMSFEECTDWARRLVDHASICYSSFGQKCYQEIKDNGGMVTAIKKGGKNNPKYYEKYGQLQIQVMPFIEELNKNSDFDDDEDEQEYDLRRRILRIDLSILKTTRPSRSGIKDPIYLFGTHSTLLLFATGMLEICEEQHDTVRLAANIRKAERLFTYAWATAHDGVLPFVEGNVLFLDRKLELKDTNAEKDSLIQGLYAHRMTQFADLGKVFAAVCRVLLLSENPKDAENKWKEIWRLLDALHGGEHCNSATSLYQQRYNGHLSSHFENIRKYFHDLKEKPLQGNIIERRNKIIREIFRCVLKRNE